MALNSRDCTTLPVRTKLMVCIYTAIITCQDVAHGVYIHRNQQRGKGRRGGEGRGKKREKGGKETGENGEVVCVQQLRLNLPARSTAMSRILLM